MSLSPMTTTCCLIGLVFGLGAACHYAASRQTYGAKEPDVAPPAPSEDWQRLGPPQPGDWLYVFEEPGQTFAEYRELVRKPAPEERRTIYVAPLGRMAEERGELLERAAGYFGVFFDADVALLPSQAMPRSCYVPSRRQYEAGRLLERVLVPLSLGREDMLAMIGLTADDLYHGDLSFVFGIGAHRERLGLCSVHRFIPRGADPDQLALIRTCKTATHEVCHMLGMAHCTFYNCLMNGSNSLRESDRRSPFLCPVCVRKLEWYLGFDRRARYERLKAFFEGCALQELAAFCERRIAELPEAAQAQDADR